MTASAIPGESIDLQIADVLSEVRFPTNKDALWRAYNYAPDNDVVRAPMKIETLAHALEELMWEFVDMSDALLPLLWGQFLKCADHVVVPMRT